MPKMYIDGILIAEIDEATAGMLTDIAQASEYGLNMATTVLPPTRDDFTTEVVQVERAVWETPVEKRRVELTLEFTRRGQAVFKPRP